MLNGAMRWFPYPTAPVKMSVVYFGLRLASQILESNTGALWSRITILNSSGVLFLLELLRPIVADVILQSLNEVGSAHHRRLFLCVLLLMARLRRVWEVERSATGEQSLIAETETRSLFLGVGISRLARHIVMQ